MTEENRVNRVPSVEAGDQLLGAGTFVVRSSGARLAGQLWIRNGEVILYAEKNWYTPDVVESVVMDPADQEYEGDPDDDWGWVLESNDYKYNGTPPDDRGPGGEG